MTVNHYWSSDDDRIDSNAYARDQFDRAVRRSLDRLWRVNRLHHVDVAIEVSPARMIDPIDPRRI